MKNIKRKSLARLSFSGQVLQYRTYKTMSLEIVRMNPSMHILSVFSVVIIMIDF